MPPHPHDLDWNEAIRDKLWDHGLTPEQARDVLFRAPKLFAQKATTIIRSDGSIKEQPARIIMVGPDRAGQLLTFILEYPDGDGYSHIVTGWPADSDEFAKYGHPGGSQR